MSAEVASPRFMRSLRLALAAFALMGLAAGPTLSHADDEDEGSCRSPDFSESFACRQIIVQRGPTFASSAVAARHGLRVIGEIPQLGQVWFETPTAAGLSALIEDLKREPGVLGAERNEDFVPPECRQLNIDILELGDGLGDLARAQPALGLLHSAGSSPAIGSGVLIAVLDTGISRVHPDLAGALVTPGIDLVSGTTLADDLADGIDENANGLIDEGWGHGTAVAGLIRLVAPGARLLPVRVLDDECQGSAFWLADGIVRAVDAGADIINASLGASEESDAVEAALEYAARHGVLIIASSGHLADSRSGEDDDAAAIAFPANAEQTLAVGALDGGLRATAWGAYGEQIDLTAPGVALIAPYRAGYAQVSGTSFATALASGAAAAAAASHPELAADGLATLLELTAVSVDSLNSMELRGGLGAGVPDVAALLAAPSPPAPPTSTTVGRAGSRTFERAGSRTIAPVLTRP